MCQVMIVTYWTVAAAATFETWAHKHGWRLMNEVGTKNDQGQFVLVMGRRNHS